MSYKFIIKALIFYPLFIFSFFCKRNKGKVCFGGEANAKYLFLFMKKQNLRKIWISTNARDFEYFSNLNVEVYKRWSAKGLFHSLTAGIYVFTHDVHDINRWTCSGAKLVHLYHGLPVKKVSNDDKKHNHSSLLYRMLIPSHFFPFDVQLVTGSFFTNIFQRCFYLKEDACVQSMFPRNILLTKSREDVELFLRQTHNSYSLSLIEKMKKYNRVYIYMPTWRDSGTDFLELANFNYKKLNKILQDNNDLFLFKLHPATFLNKKSEIEQFSNFEFIESTIDVYPLLKFTDCLITDYSSIYFDYALMNKDIILYMFDLDKYLACERELYFDMAQLPALNCNKFDDLCDLIQKRIIDKNDRTGILNQVWGEIRDTQLLEERIIALSRN